MFRQWWVLRFCCLGLLSASILSLSGCFTESSEQVVFDEEDVMLGGELTSVGEPAASIGGPSSGPSAILSGLSEPAVHALVKRVTQTLTQSSPDGLETSHAQLSCWFEVRVEPLGRGDSSYRVTYQRISYSHKLPGESLSYDTNTVSAVVPPTLAHLQALARSGFAFRTTGGGRSLELTEVPAAVFDGDLKGTAAAEFVSDQIGLLLLGPETGGVATAPAAQARRIESPVPMTVNTRYSIKSTGQGTVTLDMLGSVSSQPQATQVQLAGGSASVKLGGGHAFGEMTIDTSSGVTTRADWNRYLEISLLTEGSERIDQRKHEVVTIRAAGTAVEPPPIAGGLVQPATAPVQPAGVGR